MGVLDASRFRLVITKFESVDAQFCSSDSFAAAYAIAHLC